jgi:hypothetical protein
MGNWRAIRWGIATFVCSIVSLAIMAIAYVPDPFAIKHTATKTGVFRDRFGGIGLSAKSSLGNQPLRCGASLLGASSSCNLAKDGQLITVDFAAVPSMTGVDEVPYRVRIGDRVSYESSPEQIRANWVLRSLLDIFFPSIVLGFLGYLSRLALNQRKHR